MEDYSQGKIYQIIDDKGKRYIGSTIQTIHRRFQKHISSSNNDKRKCSSIGLNLQKSEIYLIESYQCDSRKELLKRERYWIEKLECVNQIMPCITYEEKKEYNRQRNKTDKYKEDFNIRRKRWRHFKSSWGYNNYLGTSLNLLDISPDLFQ